MEKYVDAVGIITLVILIPLTIASAWSYIAGDITLSAYVAEWKEALMLLIGFWIRGASEQGK